LKGKWLLPGQSVSIDIRGAYKSWNWWGAGLVIGGKVLRIFRLGYTYFCEGNDAEYDLYMDNSEDNPIVTLTITRGSEDDSDKISWNVEGGGTLGSGTYKHNAFTHNATISIKNPWDAREAEFFGVTNL